MACEGECFRPLEGEVCEGSVRDGTSSLVVAGGCAEQADALDGVAYLAMGFTASGAPYFRSSEEPYHYIYWDPDCNGGDASARWIIDSDVPNVTAVSDLDGDSNCDYVARTCLEGADNCDIDSQAPPLGTETWKVKCGTPTLTWQDNQLTLATAVPPSPPAVGSNGCAATQDYMLVLDASSSLQASHADVTTFVTEFIDRFALGDGAGAPKIGIVALGSNVGGACTHARAIVAQCSATPTRPLPPLSSIPQAVRSFCPRPSLRLASCPPSPKAGTGARSFCY